MAVPPDDAQFRQIDEYYGRDFQVFSIRNNIYHVPVDDDEEERLGTEADILNSVFGGLFFPNIRYPRRVLDCGYGRGDWAIAMAQTYTDSKVTALDIYKFDFPDQPENLIREYWNLNVPLLNHYRQNYYDLVHSRCVGPGIKKDRWDRYVRELGKLSKRGGWVQLAEFYYNIQSHSGRLTENHALYKWGACYRHAMERDRNPRIFREFERMLREARLTNIHFRKFDVPIGDWGVDTHQNQIGRANQENMGEILSSLGLYPFKDPHRLGLADEHVYRMIADAREEMNDHSLKLYIPLYVAWAQRT